MGALSAEIIKLRRSLAWPVVILAPVILVLAGASTRLASGEELPHGWDTVWLQSVGFYGLFPLAVAIAILGSLVWRAEHRGSNWNALMSTPTPTLQVVLAKTAVVSGLTAVMQLVLVLAVVAVGKIGFGLPGMLPAKDFGVAALLVLATVPVAALQSTISLFLRSFAAPVALALVGSGLSTVALLALGGAALLSPYALATRTALLGTGSFADTGSITMGAVLQVCSASVAATVIVVLTTTRVVEHRDTRI